MSSLPAETAHLSLIKSSLNHLVPEDVDLLRINGDFIQQNGNSAAHIFYGALTVRDILLLRSDNKALSDTDKQQVEGAFMQVLNSEVKPDIKTYQDTLAQLITLESSPETIAKFRETVLQRLPLALGFSAKEDKQKRKEQWAAEDAKENEVTLANGTA